MKRFGHARVLFLSSVVAFGCGSDDQEAKPASCDFEAQTGCAAAQVCEQVDDGTTACFAPITLKGRVVQASDGSTGIEAARVVARDVNGALVSRKIAVSAADGSYSLVIPAQRKNDGTPTIPELTLRADAAGYATFPSGLRISLPVDVTKGQVSEAGTVIEHSGTVVALDALGNATALGRVSGVVKASGAGGTLVVAGGRSGIADADGAFMIFNVPAGSQEVHGYLGGLQLTSAAGDVPPDGELKVELSSSAEPLATVSGDVAFVNAGSQTTSVVLVVQATFNEALARGEVPRGLRQYPVTGKYEFLNVPNGDYIVLVAFENDGLVRDPDTSIGGTAIQKISVASAAVSVTGFKITGALDVVAPGSAMPEPVSGTPSFVWADDSSEEGYELFVYDTFGELKWKNSEVPSVSGAKTVTATYSGDPLAPGYYQFKAVSWKSKKGTTSSPRTYIAATEDLKGVFIVP